MARNQEMRRKTLAFDLNAAILGAFMGKSSLEETALKLAQAEARYLFDTPKLGERFVRQRAKKYADDFWRQGVRFDR